MNNQWSHQYRMHCELAAFMVCYECVRVTCPVSLRYLHLSTLEKCSEETMASNSSTCGFKEAKKKQLLQSSHRPTETFQSINSIQCCSRIKQEFSLLLKKALKSNLAWKLKLHVLDFMSSARFLSLTRRYNFLFCRLMRSLAVPWKL